MGAVFSPPSGQVIEMPPDQGRRKSNEQHRANPNPTFQAYRSVEPDDICAIVLTTAKDYLNEIERIQKECKPEQKVERLKKLLQRMYQEMPYFEQHQPTGSPSSQADTRRPSSGATTRSAKSEAAKSPQQTAAPTGQPTAAMKGFITIEVMKEKEKQYEQKLRDMEKQIESIVELNKQHNLKLQQRAAKFEKENQDLLLRLSKIAADKLTDNNPAITDLSDPNRPTKLGEIYSELYDDQWTDAFEGLQNNGYTELETIDILRETLLNAVSFCERNSEVFITHTKELVNSFFARNKIQAGGEEPSIPPMQKYMTLDIRQGKAMQREISSVEVSFSQLYSKWKPKKKDGKVDRQTMGKTILKGPSNIDDKMVNLRKDIAIHLLPMVQKAYFRQSWDNDCIPQLKPYIKKCLYVGWMMAVQAPPLSLVNSDIKTMSSPYFNPEQYKVYTQNGKMIKYVVWPTMLLHEKGPVLCKGVAQGFNLNK